MKIKPEHFAVLKTAVEKFDTPFHRSRYKAAGLSDKRFRWDCLWASKVRIGDGVGIKGDLDLYAYMNDDHIDTALRSIVKPLESV